MRQEVLHKVTVLQLFCILLAVPTKVLVVHSLLALEEGEDHGFGVSDDSSPVMRKKDGLRTATNSFFTKVNGNP